MLAPAPTPTPTQSPTPPPNNSGVKINAQGTFPDVATWIYRTPDGKFGYGPAIKGTNEILVPTPMQSITEGVVTAITHVHHQMDTMGYPLHISLYEKLFATTNKVTLFSSVDKMMWKYEPGDPANKESIVSAPGGPSFTVTGPIDASGLIPEQYKPTFEFARNALDSIVNLPDSQKTISHYVVLFAETDTTTWVEFAPVLAPNEVPHLGCQAQQGRDMVFGIRKKSDASKLTEAAFLQCF